MTAKEKARKYAERVAADTWLWEQKLIGPIGRDELVTDLERAYQAGYRAAKREARNG